MLRVKDIMTSPVSSILPNALIEEALDKMLKQKISGLPVVDADGTLVGVISEFDALLLLDPNDGQHGPIAPVVQFMTADVKTIDENAPIEEAARLMLEHSVRRLPVVDGERLVGIITRRDMARLIRQHRESYAALPWRLQCDTTQAEH